MNLLEQIENFGAIDAENDERLIEYFYKTELIDNLADGKKSVVIGRKGTGKTAIYKYIQSIREEYFVPLLFRDYPWKIHDQFKNNIVAERESYVNSWTFFFYIEILKKIVSDKKQVWDAEERKKLKRIKKWLKKNWGSFDFDFKNTLNPRETKSIFNFSPQIMGNALGSIAKEISSGKNGSETLTEYNKKLDDIVSKLLARYNSKVILAFDELDLAYSANDKNYVNRLIGLLLTAYSFFGKFDKVQVLIFLRSDIFNGIDFQDKNKIKDNMVEFLDWESENSVSRLSLKNIAVMRIRSNTGEKSDNFDVNWNRIFDAGTISKNKLKWNFVIDRTFLRPRDVIKFMNLALEQAKLRLVKNPEGKDAITNEDMHAIRNKYSTYLFEELKDEMSGKYPEYNAYLEILRDIHKVSFTKEVFENSFNNVSSRFGMTENSGTIMERLYEFSIIGFYKPGGGGYGGSGYRYQYTSEYQPFNPTAIKFQVHAGFKEYLELIES